MHGNGHSYSYKLKELQTFFSTVNSYMSNFVSVRRLFFYRETEWEALVD